MTAQQQPSAQYIRHTAHEMQKILADHHATMQLGTALAQRALPGDLIGLGGEPGSGKTTLARGFIRFLTRKITDVQSPTFNLVQIYSGNHTTIYHADLYRITSENELDELGLDEACSALTLVEWPERSPTLLRLANLHVKLDFSGSGRVAQLTMKNSWRNRLHDLDGTL